MINKLNRYLAIYYVLWQFIHFSVNGYSLFINPAFLQDFLGGSMSTVQFKALLLSGWIDFITVSPLGIIFGTLYFFRRYRAAPLLLMSLAMAVYGSYSYTYLHILYNLFSLSAVNLMVIWVFFLLVIVFTLTLLWQVIKQMNRNQPKAL